MMTRVQRSLFATSVVLIGCSGDGGTPPEPVDRVAPSVLLTANRTMVTTPGDVLLSVTATDSSGVVRVELYEQVVGVDVTPRMISSDTLLPYQHVRPFTIADDGTHEFTAKAYDAAGNVGSSLKTSVVVAIEPDNTPPSVLLTANRSMVTTPGDVLLSVTATDSSGVVRVELYEQVVGVDVSARMIWSDTLLHYERVRRFLTGADDGTHEFTAKAYDVAGNVGISPTTSVVVAIGPDNTPPTVIGTTPNDGETNVPVDATITATFSELLEPQSITSASFTVRPGVTGTVTYAETTATFVPAIALALGTTYTATISTAARDVAGNPLAAPHSWTFTTRSSSPSGTFETVHPGFFYTCGVKTGGDAYCWGQNDAGQLGDGTTTVRLTPAGVLGGLSFTGVTAARQGYHSCGVTVEGDAYCWGENTFGQLGDGTTAWRRSPTAVSGGHSFASVSTGRSHSCGVTTTGEAYCWGENSLGELGDGTTTQRRTPVAVSGGLSFAMISVGAYHTCGVTTAGTAYCWGLNGSGGLGDGTTTDRAVPVAVQGGHTFAMVSAGAGATCGVTTAGAGYCWGDNFFGVLGNGTTSTTPQTTPVAVIGGRTFVSLSVSVSHVCALTPAGTAHCWGRNGSGQLGDGTTIHRTSPGAVVGGFVFRAVRVGDGGGCSCGVTVDGLAYCWGDNLLGQLGNGTTDDSSVPVKVAGQP